VINKVVAVSLKKKEEKALQEKYNQRFPGRKLEKDEKKKLLVSFAEEQRRLAAEELARLCEHIL
jgi:hypothetical protein